jgi:hypothetical protein
MITFCSIVGPSEELTMRRWTMVAAVAALVAAAWWQWPAAAQRAAQPAGGDEMITFDQYRDFRLHDLQQRQARLARQLAAPGLSAADKANIERRKILLRPAGGDATGGARPPLS